MPLYEPWKQKGIVWDCDKGSKVTEDVRRVHTDEGWMEYYPRESSGLIAIDKKGNLLVRKRKGRFLFFKTEG